MRLFGEEATRSVASQGLGWGLSDLSLFLLASIEPRPNLFHDAERAVAKGNSTFQICIFEFRFCLDTLYLLLLCPNASIHVISTRNLILPSVHLDSSLWVRRTLAPLFMFILFPCVASSCQGCICGSCMVPHLMIGWWRILRGYCEYIYIGSNMCQALQTMQLSCSLEMEHVCNVPTCFGLLVNWLRIYFLSWTLADRSGHSARQLRFEPCLRNEAPTERGRFCWGAQGTTQPRMPAQLLNLQSSSIGDVWIAWPRRLFGWFEQTGLQRWEERTSYHILLTSTLAPTKGRTPVGFSWSE